MTTDEEDTIQLIENPFHSAESTTLDGLGPCPMEKYANVPGAPEPLPDPPQTPKRLIRKTKCNQCSGMRSTSVFCDALRDLQSLQSPFPVRFLRK